MNYRMLIDGTWREALNGKSYPVTNPATEETILELPFGDASDAEVAIQAAHAALPRWRSMTAYERGSVLRRIADLIYSRLDELAPIMVRESGKAVAEARGEWTATADMFDWFSEEGKRAYGRTIPARKKEKRLLSLPVPVGVVATITAWNFPAYLPARKWAAALSAGCTVVARPSELTPMCAMALATIMVEAGIPKGVMNLVNGEPESIGQAFVKSPLVNKISFTGSQRVGRLLMHGAAEHIQRLSLELGGSAPVIICDDVDLDQAAQQAVTAKFRNNGQVCISPARFFVSEKIMPDFIEACQAKIKTFVLGNGLDAGVTHGPLVTAAGRERVERFVEDAIKKGATVIAGAKRPEGLSNGYFYEPTLLTRVSPLMQISCEEVFGPVMPIVPFNTLDEALHLANNTPFGLAGYVLTKDMSNAIKAYEGLEFGIIGVNDLVPATAEAPFGGIKQSGFGREGSQEGLEEYLETKFVSIGL